MKIKFLFASIAAFVLTVSVAFAQTKPTPKSEIIKVWGNCGMCKKTIEKSLKTDGIATANWDKNSKIIAVSYDSTMISVQQIQQHIAAAGYDNEGVKGDDTAYANLHSCCQYERKSE